MANKKWKEIKLQPSMLPGPAVPGSCLASFHFRWAIHPIRPVQLILGPCRSMNQLYTEVQLDSTPEIEVFHMQFERCAKIERGLSNSIQNASFSGFKFSWTTLYTNPNISQLETPDYLCAHNMRKTSFIVVFLIMGVQTASETNFHPSNWLLGSMDVTEQTAILTKSETSSNNERRRGKQLVGKPEDG